MQRCSFRLKKKAHPSSCARTAEIDGAISHLAKGRYHPKRPCIFYLEEEFRVRFIVAIKIIFEPETDKRAEVRKEKRGGCITRARTQSIICSLNDVI